MFDFFLASENMLFTIAIGIVIALGLLEGLGMLIGLSMVALFDNLSPIDMDFEIDANAADVSSGGLTQLLGWLCLNRLPLMVWLVLFFTCFAVVGYVINYTSLTIFNLLLPVVISATTAVFAGLVLTGRVGHMLANVIPQNETSAVSTTTFGGRVALITTGTATIGSPAQASLVDDFKQKHYVMVEPLEEDQNFATGEQVILVQKGTNGWQVISAN